MTSLAEAGELLATFFRNISLTCPVGGSPEPRRFIAIAGKDGLRWILPDQCKSIVCTLGQWRPYTWRARIFWAGIKFATGHCLLHFVPRTECATADLSGVNWKKLGWVFDHPPAPVIYVGTPGPGQKLVATLIDPRNGEPHIVIKVALAPLARDKLRQEFEALHQIASERVLRAPRALLAAQSFSFTVQTFLPGRPTGPKLTTAHVEFLIKLFRPEMRINLAIVRRELVRRRDQLTQKGALTGERLAWINRTLAEETWSGMAPVARMHGDFAPWNLKWAEDGTIYAIDWEDSVLEGLPYADLHRYSTMVTKLLKRSFQVPWSQYTQALRCADPSLTAEMASLLRRAAAAANEMYTFAPTGEDRAKEALSGQLEGHTNCVMRL